MSLTVHVTPPPPSPPLRPAFLRAMQRLMLSAEARAKRAVSGPVLKVRTGFLRAGIEAEVRPDPLEGILRARAAYASAHELGGRPHPIVARRARVLRFAVGGVVLYRRQVAHPGTPARPFLRPSIEAGLPRLQADLDAAIREGR